MDSSAGGGDWGTNRLKSKKEREEERKQNGEDSPPVSGDVTTKAPPKFNVWPKEVPRQEIVYQWKCPQPEDNGQKMKLVQAAYACAVHFMPQCTHVLIRGTNFDQDGFSTLYDRHHITVSYRNEGLIQKVFETAHCYTSENYLRVTGFESTGIIKAYTQVNNLGLRYWPDPTNAVTETHIGRPYAQDVNVATG